MFCSILLFFSFFHLETLLFSTPWEVVQGCRRLAGLGGKAGMRDLEEEETDAEVEKGGIDNLMLQSVEREFESVADMRLMVGRHKAPRYQHLPLLGFFFVGVSWISPSLHLFLIRTPSESPQIGFFLVRFLASSHKTRSLWVGPNPRELSCSKEG